MSKASTRTGSEGAATRPQPRPSDRGASRGSTASPRLRVGEFPPARAAELRRLFRQTHWASDRTLADIRRMLAHTSFTLSAWDGDSLVAFCRVLSDFTYRAVLYDVVVDDAWRGRGVGSRLVDRAMRHPRLRRVETWYLATPDQHSFYQRLGWSKDAERFMVWRRDRGTTERRKT